MTEAPEHDTEGVTYALSLNLDSASKFESVHHHVSTKLLSSLRTATPQPLIQNGSTEASGDNDNSSFYGKCSIFN